MKYTVITPCEELKDFVSHFWVATWDTRYQPNTSYYVIANSSTEISFGFTSDKKNSELLFSTLQGHTYLPKKFSVDGFYHLIGVSLHSYAIPVLFNISSSEIKKEFMSLNTFLGNEGIILNEMIASTTNSQQRIKILSDYFISILRKRELKDKLIINAIKNIRRSKGKIKIDELADDFYLSQKQLSRRFKEFSGFSPKMYSRIIRFESVIKSYPNFSTKLSQLAYENGYYDQAHFIREFKSFTGFTPKDFWKLSKEFE